MRGTALLAHFSTVNWDLLAKESWFLPDLLV